MLEKFEFNPENPQTENVFLICYLLAVNLLKNTYRNIDSWGEEKMLT